MEQKQKYDVAAYIWPAYTGDEKRTRMFWPEGMGEWQSVKNAVCKYPGHQWPRKPLWGYVNEADPYVMEMEIKAATDHGVNVFIYDWYWYDGRPFLENCLNDGFLKAKNREKMKFYLMWANHDVNHTWDIRLSWDQEDVIWKGSVDREEFEKIAHRVIERYFHLPEYYTINGEPVFQIYDLTNLVKGLGGSAQTREALEWFREETIKAGFPGLHLQLTYYESSLNLSGVDNSETVEEMEKLSMGELLRMLGFSSITHYQYVHFTNIDRDYGEILPDVKKEWDKLEKEYDIPYFPHISIGWDNNPRFIGPRAGVVKNNTPEAVKQGFLMAKEYADKHPDQAPLITINSWNEWTETSYLEPDDLYGYGYLEAVKEVFKK